MKKIVIFNFLLGSSALFAQNNFDRLHIYFDSIEKHHTFSGSVALAKNNELLFERHFGVLEAKTNTPVNSNSKFRIGSISKTFTATLIMKAVEEKKLKTKDKLSKYFPTIVNAKSITIEHLLRHQSGIFNFTNDSLFWKINEQPISQEQMIATLSSYKSQFKPGTQYEYSNSGYYLLACILEKVYNKSYSSLLEEKITQPLSLKHTYEGTILSAPNNEALSVGYSFAHHHWKDLSITHSSHLLGAGGMVSTPTELTQFMTALLEGKVISAKNLTLMKTMKMNYGYGLIVLPYHLNFAYGHTGGIDTYSAVTGYFDKEGLAFGMTMNGYEGSTNDVLVAMLSAYFGDSIKMPSPIHYYPVKEELLGKYEGIYFNNQHKLKLIVSAEMEDKTLKIKLQNQPSIKTIPSSNTLFEVPMVSAKFTFNEEKNTVTLNQYGNKIEFIKE